MLHRGGQGPGKGPNIYIVYRVLSIYRVLPGFREFAVFVKSKRFFVLFFGWVFQKGGQGPGKGPNVCMYTMILPLHFSVPIYGPWQKKKKKKKKNTQKIKRGAGPLPWPECIYTQQSILKQGFQKTHFPMVLEVEKFFAVDLANF